MNAANEFNARERNVHRIAQMMQKTLYFRPLIPKFPCAESQPAGDPGVILDYTYQWHIIEKCSNFR